MADLGAVRSRKWQITINNPEEHNLTHDQIKSILSDVKGLIYWCMCDETGDECETLHTHLYIYLSSARSAEWVNNRFPNMHREKTQGTSSENRAYILKDGEKFNKQPDGHYHYVDSRNKTHDGINHSDTFEESGECPVERQGKSKDADIIVEMIKSGATDSEIVDAVSSAYKDLDRVQRTRSMYRDKTFANSWRNLEVTYMYGKTGTGKTRSVMDKYGYAACYRVTDYKHPFDTYDGQDVIIFEEFRSSLKHGDMLNYLDGYPLLLPCRYFNRQACYTKVFLISNISLEEQYARSVDEESRNAFFRRIHKVRVFDGERILDYDNLADYFHRNDWANLPKELDF